MQIEPLSEKEAAAALGEIMPLSREARDAMLDLVLAWANLDMSASFLAAETAGLDPSQGADRYGRKVIAEKLKGSALALERVGNQPFAGAIRKASEEYAERALIRRRVAHSRCAGLRRSSPRMVVFMPYESDEPSRLAVELFSLDALALQTKWARELHSVIMQYIDKCDFFKMRKP